MSGPTLFLNDFTILDLACGTKAQGVAGESFYVSAELEGELDPQDFLLDFGPAKKILKALVDETFDHKLALPMGANFVRAIPGGYMIQSSAGEAFVYACGPDAVAELPEAEITPETIAGHLARLAPSRLPKNVKRARFELRASPRFETEASFRYTHGLRFHAGNCQRLFHGHRNPIEAWVNGVRDNALESWLAREWADAHFVAAATLVNAAELDLPVGRRQAAHPGRAKVAYVSSQGQFRGELPAARVVLTDAEPSIETLARLAHGLLRERVPTGSSLRVVAYEGLNKGASYSG